MNVYFSVQFWHCIRMYQLNAIFQIIHALEEVVIGSIKTLVVIIKIFKRKEKSAKIFNQSEVTESKSGNAAMRQLIN